MSYFHTGAPALSSALSVFTAEFGMRSGGTRSLWPPGKSVGAAESSTPRIRSITHALLSFPNTHKPLWCYMVKPHDELVRVSFIHY